MTTQSRFHRSAMLLIMFVLAFAMSGCGGGGSSGSSAGLGSDSSGIAKQFTAIATFPTKTSTNVTTFTMHGSVPTPQRDAQGTVTDTVRMRVSDAGGSPVASLENIPVQADGSFSASVTPQTTTGEFSFIAELMRLSTNSVDRTAVATESGKVAFYPAVNPPTASTPATVTLTASTIGVDYAVVIGTLSNYGGKAWQVFHEYGEVGKPTSRTDVVTASQDRTDPLTCWGYLEFGYETPEGATIVDKFHAVNPDGGELTSEVTFKLKTRNEVADAEMDDALLSGKTVQDQLVKILGAAKDSHQVFVKKHVVWHRDLIQAMLSYFAYVVDDPRYSAASVDRKKSVQAFLRSVDDPLTKAEAFLKAAAVAETLNPNMGELPEGFIDFANTLESDFSKAAPKTTVSRPKSKKVERLTLNDFLSAVPRPEKWAGVQVAVHNRISAKPAAATTTGTVVEQELFRAMVRVANQDASDLSDTLDEYAGTHVLFASFVVSGQALLMEQDGWLAHELATGSAKSVLTSDDLLSLSWLVERITKLEARTRTSDSSSQAWFCGEAWELWVSITQYLQTLVQ